MPSTFDDPPSPARLDLAAEMLVRELHDALIDLLTGLIAHASGGEHDQNHAHEIRLRAIHGIERGLKEFKSAGF